MKKYKNFLLENTTKIENFQKEYGTINKKLMGFWKNLKKNSNY